MAVCALNRVVNRVNSALNASGGGSLLQPSFLLTFDDLGAGVVDTTADRGGVAATFTRATAAWTKLSSGLWGAVATGIPRYTYLGANTAVGAGGGYFAEGARTTLVTPLASIRDMTDAAWVKGATMTAAKTGIGIDGVTNSCSRLTGGAVSATNTVLQTLVAAGSSRTYSVWLRRVTGTGTINITQDGGVGWTDVTSQLNSASFTRVELNASQANAAFGIQIVTSGDVILADFNQFEAGASASSPIDVAAVTRNADVLSYPTAPWMNAAAGTFFAAFNFPQLSASSVYLDVNDGTTNERIRNEIAATTGLMTVVAVDGGVTVVSAATANAYTVDTNAKAAMAYELNNYGFLMNAGTVVADTSATVPTVTTLQVGNNISGAAQSFGTISRIAYYPRRLPNSVLVGITA